MLLDFDSLYKKYNFNVKGVLHVGAHFGQEMDIYERNNIKDVIFFEALPHTFEILKEKVGGKAFLVNKALGNDNKKIEMFVEQANNGQSSSILKPDLHMKQYPWIKFTKMVTVDMIKMDDFMLELNSEGCMGRVPEYNLLNMDVQGYELEVLKGSVKTLENIDYIYSEVNRAEVYKNCAKVEQLDDFLLPYGFVRSETTWDGGTWGDALYIKYKQ